MTYMGPLFSAIYCNITDTRISQCSMCGSERDVKLGPINQSFVQPIIQPVSMSFIDSHSKYSISGTAVCAELDVKMNERMNQRMNEPTNQPTRWPIN